MLNLEIQEWGTSLLEGDTLFTDGKEIKETAKVVGIIYGLNFIQRDIEDKLNRQWEEEQELINKKREEGEDEE